METPSSTRRITRSQAKAAFSNTTNISSKKIEETEKSGAKKSKQRTCLFDITNDSPIVGLASGNLNETPISSIAKQKRSNFCNKTPNSGEALLRSQVKNLLQKVEEEAVISKFLSFKNGSKGLITAPTPTNTPQVLNFNVFESLGSVLESPIEDHLTVSKVESVISDEKKHLEIDEKDMISRSLFHDFSDKSKSPSKEEDDDDEDDASIWSIQVNASIQDEDEEGESKLEVVEIDELCEGMKNISVKEEMTFMGKHIRFVYNSDDELVEEEVFGDVLRLKGLPTPKGKHLRFQDEDDE
ncbi:hypothetical protein RND81_13G213400 [Saponaria officinalis]|uniref:Uncharacterized protein n=1 Tax=Saponaria officinalis TaxID=3572 RepID=A0AAW1H6R9_SAPOF